MLRRRVREYQLQDLQCVKCKQVASGHLRASCGACGGELRNTQAGGALRKGLTVFHNIARHHEFEMLGELAAFSLNNAS